MKRVTFLTTIIITFCLCFQVHAAKLLIVDSQEGEPYETVRKSVVSELASLGYVENKNLEVAYHSVGNHKNKILPLWNKNKDKGYDAIFVNGTVAVMGFKEVALDDPENRFVFGAVTDPVGVGVIDNFEGPPKSNFTGVCYPVKVIERLRFIRKVMPGAKKIGYIFADMPQSHSYKSWIEDALKLDEFKGLEVIFRKVEFVANEGGHKAMTLFAKKHVTELRSKVDLFMSPNDQMGVQSPFAKMVYRTARKKPLLGLGRKDVMEKWGATMSVYPSLKGAGKQIARMIKQLFEGEDIRNIIPQWPEYGVAFDLKKAAKFGIEIPADLIQMAGEDIIR